MEPSANATTQHTSQRGYLARFAAVALALGGVLSAALAALVLWNFQDVPFLGMPSIVVVMLVTGQLMPIAATLATVWRVRKQLEAGVVPMSTQRSIRRLSPLPLWMRLIVLGIHGLLAATGVLVALWLGSINAIPYWRFVLLQGIFGGVLAAYVTVLSAYRLITDAAAEHVYRGKVPAQRASTTEIRP